MHNVVVFICHVPILGIWKQTEENVLSGQGRELSKNVLSKFKNKKIDFMTIEILPCHRNERSNQ